MFKNASMDLSLHKHSGVDSFMNLLEISNEQFLEFK